jgi:YfiH family protein
VPGIVHGITGRVPGLGLADGNLGYGAPRDTADAWRMRLRWSAAIGVDPDRLASARQVHGADALRVAAADAGLGARAGSGWVGAADVLLTDEPGVALLSLHADCLPLLLVDPIRPAVAVVHAGWRGTVADVAGAAVRAMTAHHGSRPADLLAFLGPAIGPCCYEVGPEVASAWRGRLGDEPDPALTPTGARWTFDLPAANALLLLRAGLASTHLEQSGVCTRCAGEAWFSHRGQGPTTGRFGAVIALAD